jgi:solute carrier family 25 iron transporter 28/37
MYPIDVIKTHQQSARVPQSALATARSLVEARGVSALFRGVSAVALGAAPAHALYFTTYECLLRAGAEVEAGADYRSAASGVRLAAAGAVSTLLQDAVMVPMDALKQRRQLSARVESTRATLHRIVAREGARALYAGYTATLAMNVPYHAVYFNAYETLRRTLAHPHASPDAAFDVRAHLASGAAAGALAAAVTTPLDVVRTRLQTQGEGAHGEYRGLVHACTRLAREEGAAALTRGLPARALFHASSAAILWSSYEYLKHALGARNDAH